MMAIGFLLLATVLPGTIAAPQPKSSKQTIIFKNVDSLAIQANVYRPAGAGPFPVIFWMDDGGCPPCEGDRVPSEDIAWPRSLDLNPKGINEPETARVFREEIEFLHAKLGKHNSSLRVRKRGKGEL